MALPLAFATIGQKITAALYNAIVNVVNQTGWVQVVPTVSGSGVTVSTYGTVTLTAATTATLTCFSTANNWYKIYFDLTTPSSSSITAVLGAVVTGYDNQQVVAIGATATSAQALNGASWGLNANGLVGEHTMELTLYNPAQAVATQADLIAGSTGNPMTSAAAGSRVSHLQQRALTAFTSITIAVSAGTMTGVIRVEALNNG